VTLLPAYEYLALAFAGPARWFTLAAVAPGC
jgi:hypothetical protein